MLASPRVESQYWAAHNKAAEILLHVAPSQIGVRLTFGLVNQADTRNSAVSHSQLAIRPRGTLECIYLLFLVCAFVR